jgi:xanthine dehydrogenase accessory factor
MRNIYAQLINFLDKKKPLALATIIETKGSTPQVAGATAIFSAGGLEEGTLGGGLLEADSQKKSVKALKNKESRFCQFSLNAEISSAEEAICGGEVKILIDANPEEHRDCFRSLSRSLAERQPGVLATFINKISEDRASLLRYWIEGREKSRADLGKHAEFFLEEVKEVLAEGKPFLLKIKEKIFEKEGEGTLLFLEPVFPLPHLVIAGAGHIGQALAHLGSLLSFEVTVIDDRAEFANKERLPDADRIIVARFKKAFKNFPVTPETYLVIVTRGHSHDATVLRQCIASEAVYIGMIGSARKIRMMRKKFLDEGWATSAQFNRVHAPIGLPIQSKTVEEIAVSIASQLVLVRSQAQEKEKGLK